MNRIQLNKIFLQQDFTFTQCWREAKWLRVKGEDLQPRGRGIESWYLILDVM